ncbi:MAG TPA: hypothetical protein VHV78_00205 [Gemmatimonadaceae bacterium]|jgi:hypothetical protein|nr:hypothetical protein [Gemmatimonadaceae bacterium]
MERQILEDVFVFVGVIVAMGCFTGIVISAIKWRRRPQVSADLTGRLDEIAERLGRLENAVDASSLEIERISEGQRFTTKLLADRSPTPAVVDGVRNAGPSPSR